MGEGALRGWGGRLGRGRAGRAKEGKAGITEGPRGIYILCFIREKNCDE